MDLRDLAISPTARSLTFGNRARRHRPSFHEPSPFITLASRSARAGLLVVVFVFLVLLPVLLEAGVFPTVPATDPTPGPAPAVAPA